MPGPPPHMPSALPPPAPTSAPPEGPEGGGNEPPPDGSWRRNATRAAACEMGCNGGIVGRSGGGGPFADNARGVRDSCSGAPLCDGGVGTPGGVTGGASRGKPSPLPTSTRRCMVSRDAAPSSMAGLWPPAPCVPWASSMTPSAKRARRAAPTDGASPSAPLQLPSRQALARSSPCVVAPAPDALSSPGPLSTEIHSADG
mmetsp:Transcript_11290/g.34808  ORF Transcript_11290/g.34808 Transcript_11290/m.34808 type:complete len:200 (+) Transcript_11290:445-1044(+)|eukprot:scaffold30241_cov28-Tisochrysis_lutea.AAC.11